MREIKTITWRDLTGNKFLKALHPAMLSKENYVCTQRIRRTGDPEPEIFKVLYDREYAVNYLILSHELNKRLKGRSPMRKI